MVFVGATYGTEKYKKVKISLSRNPYVYPQRVIMQEISYGKFARCLYIVPFLLGWYLSKNITHICPEWLFSLGLVRVKPFFIQKHS